MSSYFVKGVVGAIANLAEGTLRELRLTKPGSLAVAQVEMPHVEMARAKKRYIGGTNIIANGIAPVTAIPTTAATLALYNSAGDGGVSLVIDHLHFFLGSGTPTAGATLLVTVSSAKPTAVTAQATGHLVQPVKGGQGTTGTGSSAAIWTAALTIAANSAWVALGSTFQLAAANVGQGDRPFKLGGGIIVPPEHALGIAILSGTGTSPLYSVSAIWDEVVLDLVA